MTATNFKRTLVWIGIARICFLISFEFKRSIGGFWRARIESQVDLPRTPHPEVLLS